MAHITRIEALSPYAGMEAKLLAQRAGEMQAHDILTYAEMQELTGVNVQEHRHILATARRLAREVYNKEFEVVFDVGWKCLTEVGKVGRGERELQRIQRHAGRIHEIYTHVDPTQLTPVQKHSWLCGMSITAGVGLLTHPKTLQQLESGKPPPVLTWDMSSAKDLFT